jgi:hypothetical protein
LWVKSVFALGYLALALAGFFGVGIVLPLLGTMIDEMPMPSLDHARPWLAVGMIAAIPVWLGLLAFHSKQRARRGDAITLSGAEPIDEMPLWLKTMLLGQAALIVLAFAALAFGGPL